MSNPSLSVTVRLSTSIRFTIPKPDSGDTITPSSTILEVKNSIAKDEACGNCPVDRQRLIFKGRILSDDSRTLADYGLTTDNQTIHLVKGRASNDATTTPSTGATPATTPTAAATPPFNPFSMMQNQNNSNNNNGGMPGMPNMNEMQQQLMQNPEMMSSMMESPMMQNLMSNPDTIRMMMESNPEMQRVMDSNPQMRAILNDPELMRRSMEMMRDPSAMQNMMRNQELAMSQIENLPGGFNALRRMYEDVQEPMMDAMSGMGSSNSSSNANTRSTNTTSTESSNAGADGAAMPNPWGSSTPSVPSPAPSSIQTSGSGSVLNPWGGGAASTSPWPNSASNGGMPGATANNGMPGMPAGMNLEQTISMLENPLVSNMMQQIMSDPAAMQQMMDSNPMMQQMRQSNPAAASMMSNPEMMRAMMNPNNLRAMAQAQQAMQGMGGGLNNGADGMPMLPPGMMNMFSGGQQQQTAPAPAGGSTINGLDFSSLLNQFQSANVSSSVPAVPPSGPITSPEQRFETQLNTLNDMGFQDREANIRALTACHGNVNRAVERLISES